MSTDVTPVPPLAVGVLATAVGGAVGAVARWALTVAFPVPAGHFPRTIFVVNVVGAGAGTGDADNGMEMTGAAGAECLSLCAPVDRGRSTGPAASYQRCAGDSLLSISEIHAARRAPVLYSRRQV